MKKIMKYLAISLAVVFPSLMIATAQAADKPIVIANWGDGHGGGHHKDWQGHGGGDWKKGHHDGGGWGKHDGHDWKWQGHGDGWGHKGKGYGKSCQWVTEYKSFCKGSCGYHDGKKFCCSYKHGGKSCSACYWSHGKEFCPGKSCGKYPVNVYRCW